MGKEIISTNRYVIGDEYLEVWKKNHRGYDEYEYEYCIAKEIKHGIGGYYFELSVLGGKIIKITVNNSRKSEIYEFWEELQQKIDKSYDPKKAVKNLASTAASAIPKADNAGQKKYNEESEKVKCPDCDSMEFQVIGTEKKFSGRKAVVGNTLGGLLYGPVGAVVGAAAGIKGKDGKTKFVCNKCGKVWEQKV